MAKRRPFPKNTLEEALIIAQAIRDQNAGRPFDRLLLAETIGRKPSSSVYRDLLSSSRRYGLTTGSEKSETIALTPLGEPVTAPKSPQEQSNALRQAALEPPLFNKIFNHYDRARLPEKSFLVNILEREFRVPNEYVEECANILIANGEYTQIIRDIQGAPYVLVQPPEADEAITPPAAIPGAGPEAAPELEAVAPPEEAAIPAEAQIFIGHGKNRKPLEQLEKILRQFDIPYMVATEEPHRGRPISTKVKEIMKDCNSSILIFTKDEEYRDIEGNILWRPSENVIHELGAASILYDNRIVIFKEEGLDLPTNFRDLGYITFQTDKLDAQAMDLIKELVGFGLLKITAA